MTPDDLAVRVARWVRLDLITDEQARRILDAERDATEPATAPQAPTPDTAPRAPSPVAEALGYVGGVLVLAAAATIAGRYWDTVPAGGRVAVVLAAAALLLGIGFAVPQGQDAGRRLRAVSWTLSVVAAGFGLGLLTDELLGLTGEVHVVLTGAACAAYAGLLWWRLRVALLHLVLVLAVVVTAGAAAALLPAAGDGTLAGLAVWGTGVAWLLLGWGGLVPPWQAADVAGAAAAIVGSFLALDAYPGGGTGWATVPALLTVIGLVTAGVLVRDLWLTGTGAVATLALVPALSQRWFPDTLVAPVTLLVAGALLVGVAVGVARRGGRRAFGARRAGPPRVAAAAAGAVALATAAVVVALGA